MKTQRQERFVRWAESYVPLQRKERIWLIVPVIALGILPIGLFFLRLLEFTEWHGAGRAGQSLILISILFGIASGCAILWVVDYTKLDPHKKVYAKWLARLAVIGPILIILTLFWINR
jgi:hypothetical protein